MKRRKKTESETQILQLILYYIFFECSHLIIGGANATGLNLHHRWRLLSGVIQTLYKGSALAPIGFADLEVRIAERGSRHLGARFTLIHFATTVCVFVFVSRCIELPSTIVQHSRLVSNILLLDLIYRLRFDVLEKKLGKVLWLIRACMNC